MLQIPSPSLNRWVLACYGQYSGGWSSGWGLCRIRDLDVVRRRVLMNRGVGVARRRFGDGRTVACGRGWRLLRAALLALVLSGTVTAVAGSGSAVAATALPGSWASTFGLPGVDSSVAAVAVSGGQVYVGGSFTTFGGQPTNHYAHVAEWTGTQWVSLGAGLDGNVDAVAVLGGRVYVGGSSPTPVAWRRIIWRFGMASGGRRSGISP